MEIGAAGNGTSEFCTVQISTEATGSKGSKENGQKENEVLRKLTYNRKAPGPERAGATAPSVTLKRQSSATLTLTKPLKQ